MLDGHGNDHRFSLEKIYPQKKKEKRARYIFIRILITRSLVSRTIVTVIRCLLQPCRHTYVY